MNEMIGNVLNPESGIAIGMALVMLVYAYQKKKIDKSAIFGAGIVGFLCLLAGGVRWVSPLIILFVVGHIASHHKRKLKKKLGVEQTTRTWWNVLANGGAAAIFGFFYILEQIFGKYFIYGEAYGEIYFLGLIGAIATATADTFGTELGQVYGKNPRTIIGLKRAQIGTTGAVSKEGLMFSLVGSLIISGLLLIWGYPRIIFLICFFSGVLGSMLDSVFGCTLEKKAYIDTHTNNFMTTTIAGTMIIVITRAFQL